jgi:hypothetical protein
MQELYNPPKFLTMQILEEILNEFTWPENYVLIDELPDFITMQFPNCGLCFYEGYESDMDLFFLHSDTKRGDMESSLHLFHALYVLIDEAKQNSNFKEPILWDNPSILGSLEKVKIGLRNVCILVQTYLLPCIEGDFSWVERYYEAIGKK